VRYYRQAPCGKGAAETKAKRLGDRMGP